MSTRPLIRLDSTDIEIVHRGLKISLSSVLDRLDEIDVDSKVKDLERSIDNCASRDHDHESITDDLCEIKSDIADIQKELDRTAPEDKVADLTERVEKLEKILEGI
jgi:hypothetical protein